MTSIVGIRTKATLAMLDFLSIFAFIPTFLMMSPWKGRAVLDFVGWITVAGIGVLYVRSIGGNGV